MPTSPSFDPASQGQPNAKKLKVAHLDTDDEWEAIEKPDSDGREDEEMVTVPGVEAMKDTGISEDVGTAHGGTENRLSKDW